MEGMREQPPHLSPVEEAFARMDPEAAQHIGAKIDAYGGEDYFRDRFGLGAEELSANARFGSYDGPLIDALVPDDPKDVGAAGTCPLGTMIEEANNEGGLQAVQEKFNGLSMLDSNFKAAVSERSLAIEADLKKKTLSR